MTPARAGYLLAKFLEQNYAPDSCPGPVQDAVAVALGHRTGHATGLDLSVDEALLLCDLYGFAISTLKADHDVAVIVGGSILATHIDVKLGLLRKMSGLQREVANEMTPGLGDLMGELSSLLLAKARESRKPQ